MNDIKNKKNAMRRFLDGIYTREEAETLLDQIDEPEMNEVFIQLSGEAWNESGLEDITTCVERERYKKEAFMLLNRIENNKKKVWKRIGTIAASIAVIISIGIGGYQYINHLREQQIVYLEASTSYGEKKQIALPDGTILVLNSCSYIRYPQSFIQDERKIQLEGEAYFKVKPDESQPFVVSTSRLDVRVLGTSFDVKSYETDEVVSVCVESGRVQVELPDAMLRLNANEQVFVNTTSEEHSKRKEELPVAGWIKGSLRFSSTPIRDVAKELERMYNCQITFAPDQKFVNQISGEHDNQSLESVLKSLEHTSGIKYRKNGSEILLYK